MIKRIVKILAAFSVAIVLLVPAVALFLDDETLTSALETVPGAGQFSEPVIRAKQSIAKTLSQYMGDAFAALDSMFLDIFGSTAPPISTRKVVIDLARTPPLAIRPPAAPSSAPSAPPPAAMAPPRAVMARPPAPPAPSVAEPEFKATIEKAPRPLSKAPPPVKPAARKSVKKTAKPPVKRTAKKTVATGASKDPSAGQDHKRGLLFYKGIGVDKDFKKAARWFKQAARKGHARAQYNLGIMSYLGQGVPQDYAQAAVWFKKASEQDHAAAQYNLGFLYYEGKGVEKDDLQAFMWIDRSANLGDEKAVRARETLQKALPKEIFNQ